MATAWLDTVKKAQKTALVQDGRKKVHYTMPDGQELAEEYDLQQKRLVVRKWKKRGTLGGEGHWDFEIGEELQGARLLETSGMTESSANPQFCRCDEMSHFVWRIRNLTYPKDVYSVTVDSEGRTIAIRTSNKKYFKKFSVPDMDRARLALDQSALTFAHANNTLIIRYQKPREILEMEKEVIKEIAQLKASKDGDVECNPS